MEEIEKTNQKTEGSLAWHVVTILVTNSIVGGVVQALLSMFTIAIFADSIGILASGVLTIIFSIIGVGVGISLGTAYLLTKYSLNKEVAKKITLWTTGIVFVFNIFAVLSAGNITDILAPLVYVAAIYIALSLSFDQNRSYLESFTNQRVRLVEGLIVGVGIILYIVGLFWLTLSGDLGSFMNNSPLINDNDRAEFNQILQKQSELNTQRIKINGDALKTDLDAYYFAHGNKYPTSLDDLDFRANRLSAMMEDSAISINDEDYVYEPTEDLQQFKLCLQSDTSICWKGSPRIFEY